MRITRHPTPSNVGEPQTVRDLDNALLREAGLLADPEPEPEAET
ncbi:MAG TPA: hypothetical protein VGG75_14855 [Trebonia sp.]|jgi:hypothetical protein